MWCLTPGPAPSGFAQSHSWSHKQVSTACILWSKLLRAKVPGQCIRLTRMAFQSCRSHNTCWVTMQIWHFTIIIFKTVHSKYIQSYSANIKPQGQAMTQCSILSYPLHPAQPTNEASPWLIAQSSDTHSVLLSQQMRPVHDSLLNPMISTQSCSANKWGQSMTHCSVQCYPLSPAQWYPLSPAQPTNEASPWLNAQPYDISVQFCSANKWVQ